MPGLSQEDYIKIIRHLRKNLPAQTARGLGEIEELVSLLHADIQVQLEETKRRGR